MVSGNPGGRRKGRPIALALDKAWTDEIPLFFSSAATSKLKRAARRPPSRSSYDSSGKYYLDSPFSSNVASHFAGGEWRADFNHNQLMAVTNAGQKPTNALLTLHYDNGQKKYELQQTIAPGDQMWINLTQLIRNRVADRNGNTLPVDLKTVTYELRDLSPGVGNLHVGGLALDDTFGFSAAPPPCPSCCPLVSIEFDSGFLDLRSVPQTPSVSSASTSAPAAPRR